MKTSEKLSMITAGLALFLSGLSVYFQFFHTSNDLKVNVSVNEVGAQFVVYDAVFINTGTGYQSVSSILGWTSYETFQKHGSRHGYLVLEDPILIRPGEMLHEKIRHDCAPKNPLRESFYTGLEFTTVDSLGNRHVALAL